MDKIDIEIKGLEAYITNRLVDFYEALLARGQISPPLSHCNPSVYTPQDEHSINHVLQQDGQILED
jgi:hypothetical protein